MIELLSILDIYVVLALIIPGSIVFKIITWLVPIRVKFSSVEITYYSLIFSLLTTIVFSLMLGIDNPSDLRVSVFNWQEAPLLLFSCFIVAIVPAIVIRLIIGLRGIVSGSPWDRFCDEYISKYVHVITPSGEEYYGWIKRMSRGENGVKEISLGSPVKIIRDNNGKIIEKQKMGKELLFTEKSVAMILRKRE
mgnify:CR=1 FL=1